MTAPDYIRILKRDRIAMKSRTLPEFLQAAKARLPFAKNLGVEKNFAYFVEHAWLVFGNGK